MAGKARNQLEGWPDIHPRSPTIGWTPGVYPSEPATFAISQVAPIVGLQPAFIKRVLGRSRPLSYRDIEQLMLLDDAAETFVPRSKIMDYFSTLASRSFANELKPHALREGQVICGDAHKLIPCLGDRSVDCVVTSTPYWGVRVYGTPKQVDWADGETCPFGHEQTPEGFIRHSVELIYLLEPKLAETGSIWWNVGDTYHTRTQIRGNAYETLQAMQGLDRRKWKDHNCRRFSGGHSYLIDGEQCLIPQRIAERVSRLGYLMKSVISWRKDTSLPEPTQSRVSRSLEYILHITKERNAYFDKGAFRSTPAALGGRNLLDERDQVTDVWHLRTSNGGSGHGAQFPLSLPGRCISLSTKPGSLVVDPFAGSGTTGLAAGRMGRRFLGFDVSPEYTQLANDRLEGDTESIRIEALSD